MGAPAARRLRDPRCRQRRKAHHRNDDAGGGGHPDARDVLRLPAGAVAAAWSHAAMMSRRQWLGAALLGPLLPPAHAAEPDAVLAQVRDRLADTPVLRGEFEQRKTIKGFKNPLVSRGDFIVAKARGVVWRTQQPFASTLVLTRDRLLARQADGSVTNRMDAAQEPGLRAINETLFALITA